jgi:uncharacterized protein RhaS with RHS repeats
MRLFSPTGSQILGEYTETYDLPTSLPVIRQEVVYLDGVIPVAVTPVGKTTVTAANFFRVYADELTTPRTLANPAGTSKVWDWSKADPFGKAAPTGKVLFNLRFPGQHTNPTTGLYQNFHRSYDPAKGRYVGGIRLMGLIFGD